MLQRFKIVFLKRWKRFLFCYFFTWGWIIYGTGIPDISYMIPVKVTMAWLMTCHNGYLGGPSFYRNMIINLFIGFMLMVIVTILIIIVCSILGIDATPFLRSTVHS